MRSRPMNINVYHAPGVKMNNWFEQNVAEEIKLRQHIEQKASGTLATNEYVKHMKYAKKVQRSVGKDAMLRFGDISQIQNVNISCALGGDFFTQAFCPKGFVPEGTMGTMQHVVLGTPVSEAVGEEQEVRTLFRIERAPNDDDKNDILYYGRKFQMKLSEKDFSIRSSSLNGHQSITLTTTPSWDCTWEFVDPTPSETPLHWSERKAICIGSQVIIKHSASNTILFCPGSKRRGFFGDEFVILSAELKSNKIQNRVWKMV